MDTLIATGRGPITVQGNTDRIDRIEAERRQALLATEAQHRVRNTLTVVQGLARMSFGDLSREIVAPFEQRLHALAAVHSLLVQTAWEGADLRSVLERACEPFRVRRQIFMGGPAISVAPTAAVFYALAFHELCANAVKHGALSNDEGRLDVSWRLVEPDQSTFHLVWREQGGPGASAPAREGLQCRWLKRALSMQLGSSMVIRYPEEGLTCEFDGPVDRRPGQRVDVSAVSFG